MTRAERHRRRADPSGDGRAGCQALPDLQSARDRYSFTMGSAPPLRFRAGLDRHCLSVAIGRGRDLRRNDTLARDDALYGTLPLGMGSSPLDQDHRGLAQNEPESILASPARSGEGFAFRAKACGTPVGRPPVRSFGSRLSPSPPPPSRLRSSAAAD